MRTKRVHVKKTWRKKQSIKTVFLTFDLAACCSKSAGTSPNLSSSSPGETVGEQHINPRVLVLVLVGGYHSPTSISCSASCKALSGGT